MSRVCGLGHTPCGVPEHSPAELPLPARNSPSYKQIQSTFPLRVGGIDSIGQTPVESWRIAVYFTVPSGFHLARQCWSFPSLE